VVFDGADVDLPRPSVRRGLQVRFSPPGITADDVILDLVERLPPTRRIVVVSNDRKVRDGARRSGARVVSSDHLLTVARRP
jgi:rRNA-processing protein FCF1